MSPRSAPALQAALAVELEQIVALERVIRSAQAEQFRRIEAARVLAAEVEGVTDASSPVDREFATRAFVAELATTLVVHEATAGALIADARRLTGELSATLAALEAGVVCVRRVGLLLEVASSLPEGSVPEFEAAALEGAGGQTPSAFRRRVRRLRERLHPEPLPDRRHRAAAERRVCLEPVEDGMAWLSLYLQAERGTAIIAHLDALAAQHLTGPIGAAADGDPGAAGVGADATTRASEARTGAQLKLDLAADLLLGRAPGTGADESALGVVRPRVYVTVPVLTLLGHTDEPGELDGYGPIDADTARTLAAHAPSFRRILTHPETGAYLSYGRTANRVPADLAGYLRVRDGGCRFPGCSRQATGCDLDHTIDWATAGTTRHDNLAHLCRKHHRLKHHTGWRMTQQPDGNIRWTSPAGRDYLTTPTNPFTPAQTHEALGAVREHVVTAAAPTASDEPLAGVEPSNALRPELPQETPWAASAA